MSDQKPVGIIAAIFRFLVFWNWKKARGIMNAADEIFTGSPDGIAAAFDIQHDKLVGQYKELVLAVSQFEAVQIDKQSRLKGFNTEEERLLLQRESALAQGDAVQVKLSKETNPDEIAKLNQDYEKHKAAFTRFQTRIDEIEAQQKLLDAELRDGKAKSDKFMLRLTELQAEIKKLPQQKAEQISDFISNTTLIDLNNRINGLQTSFDRGPIEAVLKRNKELSAEAAISDKLAGTDVTMQDKEYLSDGAKVTASGTFERMLAARKNEREIRQGTAPTKVQEDRPKI